MKAEIPLNPFHLEAVATFGQMLRTCTDLGYMQRPLEELNSYLNQYHRSRYGGTIGLAGGHGSGKTHLLNWLSQEASNRQYINPVVVYAKADHASFFDLYLQVMDMLPRERIQEFINEGMNRTAAAEVRKAAATEPLAKQLETPQGLSQLVEQGNIDQNQLLLLMNEKLKEQITSEIPRILLMVNSPSQGEKAYQWLQGKDVLNPETLGVGSSLVPPNQGNDDSSAPDVVAINAMEAIAALLNLAQRPFVVMVDQLEVLFQVDTASQTPVEFENMPERVDYSTRRKIRQQTTFSAIKKMIEQLGRQNGLCFIAGNKQSWAILPRDVSPRLRLREPLPVGELDETETTNLVEEYTRGLPSKFSEQNIKDIHRLSGGNPREIIRIAYYAYEEVAGNLDAVNEAVLVKSANNSGTVADRNKLALSIAGNVFQGVGDSVLKNLDIGDGLVLDLLLKDKDGPLLALVTLKATDGLSEIDSAKRLNAIRSYLERTWPMTSLIVVTVGYSSSVIQNLLRETSTILQFDEATFAGNLLTKVTELAGKPRSKPATHDGMDPAVIKLLEGIAKRLDHLEIERTEQANEISDRFAQRTRTTSEPQRQERELRTRWDLLSVVDDLQTILPYHELIRERELMKSILIANESQLKIRQLDQIGGLYLDALAEQENLRQLSSSNLDYSLLESIERDLFRFRQDVIAELRRILRGRGLSDQLRERPVFYSLSGAGIFALLVLLWKLIFNYRVDFEVPTSAFMYVFVKYFLPAFVGSAVLFISTIFYARWWLFSRWNRYLNRIKGRARSL
jgi:hypothetical protein